MYATSLILILGTPVIAITVLLVAAERGLHIGIFDPALGGDPILFQHLFWFYSHPAVYIMILPAMGVISEIVQAFTRKNIFGYSFVAFSVAGDCDLRVSRLGASSVRVGSVGVRRPDVLVTELHGRHSLGSESVQLDRHASTRAPFSSTRRCCMRSDSSACSRSAV